MRNNEWVDKYKSLNNSFNKKLLFRLGTDAGYFSEFNNMVLAIAYCLSRRIKFILYSESSLYSKDNSWNDFFIPFSSQNFDKSNDKLNLRPYQIKNTFAYKADILFFKIKNNINYLTQDLWTEFHNNKNGFSNELFTIPELNINNLNLLQFTQVIICNIWCYNSVCIPKIDELKAKVNLPPEYISVHIRSGDKVLEKSLHPMHEYMSIIRNLGCNNVFVLTDDFSIIEYLSDYYKEYKFFTLCQVSERGYFHRDFIKFSADAKFLSHLQLFASIDLCAKSERFVGTYSSNPGMYMGMRIGEDKCIGIDYDRWLVW